MAIALARSETAAARATLKPWHCEGFIREGWPCRKILMELDWDRPSFIRKTCERCKHVNVFVEAHRAD